MKKGRNTIHQDSAQMNQLITFIDAA